MPHTQSQRIDVVESVMIPLVKLSTTPIDDLIRADLGKELSFGDLRGSMSDRPGDLLLCSHLILANDRKLSANWQGTPPTGEVSILCGPPQALHQTL
jgi:hypothetical protein